MIESIKFLKYKRLEDIEIELGGGVISIMGVNGTCKSSLLHIISNSYQTFENNSEYFKDARCIRIIRTVNQMVNPKIETLNKGDRQYNDPAPEYIGNYYECKYSDGVTLKFRKHNQKNAKRYRVIPKYESGSKDKLPYGLVIYLGLSRLNAYGEYQDDSTIQRLTSTLLLPQNYQSELLEKYKSFTRYSISKLNYEKMGELKKRGEFETLSKGYDSNTISAGEDNLMIILTAVYSLKYYADSLKDEYKEYPGILLIDELDATLHPEFQAKLITLFKEICTDYSNLSIIFTSHSMSVLQECNYHKNKVIYLTDNITKVSQMLEADEFKIKASLEDKLGRDYYTNDKIPILTEDEQARDFLNIIIEYFKNTEPYKSQSFNALQHVKLVESSFSSESLITLFLKSNIDKQNLQMIGILDGDMQNYENCNNLLLALPGKKSPEQIAFCTCLSLKNRQDETEVKALLERLINEHKCTIRYIENNISTRINEIDTKISFLKEQGKSTRGRIRAINKKVYEDFSEIFTDIFKFWVKDKENTRAMDHFYCGLRNCFKKIAPYYGLDHNVWKNEDIEKNEEEYKQSHLDLEQKENMFEELEYID